MSEVNPQTHEMPAEQSSGPSFTTILIGIALLAIGVIWLLDVSGAYSVSWFTVAAVALVGIGLALMIGAFSGEHGGLIAIGVILTVLLTFAAWTDTRFEGGIGERVYSPTGTEDLNESYRLALGTLELDLTRIDFPPGETRVDVRVGAGEALIVVPADIAVAVDWRVMGGDVTLFGNEVQSGGLLDDRRESEGYQEAERQLLLDVIVTAGSIEVRR